MNGKKLRDEARDNLIKVSTAAICTAFFTQGFRIQFIQKVQ